ncbi:MAG: response regulator, partial [Gemmatimonadaceae bacterium]|nr:response regulator [Gemmatimonadaceae bacterium]
DAKAFTELSGRLPVLEWEVLRTAFNETARALSEFQRRYRDVFDRAVDPMFLVDPTTGRVVDANPATVALTGVAATDMIGQSLPAELMPQGSGQRALRWKRPDGATLTWGLAASEVRIEGSTWLLAAYRDLTGREALAHTQKMEAVGLLAGGIAHDFNNLLGAVLTGVTAARALAGPDAAVLPALDGIEHAGTRAAQLTRQLLDFSRHDPLRVAPVDVAAAVENVRSMCSRTFERRIAIDVVVDDALPRVLGDAGEVEQALLNLCINARDALPDGGEIVIEAKARTLDADAALDVRVPRPGAYVELSVADTGTGMTDEVKARLFEPFFTTKAPGKGTGLGLPIVHGLVRQLGGAITVESTVGAGTRVRLLIPALAEREARSAPVERRAEAPRVPAYTAVPTERALVLVVDDEHTLREMMRIVLDLSGFDVVEAPDGTRALELVRLHQERLRAVLLDMQLPGARSGADTLAEIRALEPHLPVVLCTGFVRENDLARARLLGVEDILLKPLDLRALVDRLRAVIAAAPEG